MQRGLAVMGFNGDVESSADLRAALSFEIGPCVDESIDGALLAVLGGVVQSGVLRTLRDRVHG